MNGQKSFKAIAREAKMRLKNGFWQDARREMDGTVAKARESGVSESRACRYFAGKVTCTIRGGDDDAFYARVRTMLLSEGEVSDALARLTDREVFEKLSYEEKQRYMLNLSDSVRSLVGTPESGSGSGNSGKDVGDMVGGYTYTKNEDGSGCYGLTLDLGVIANNSAFEDVEIDIYRDAGGMLTHLTVNTKLVSVFNVTVELNFVSPGADSLALEFYAAVEEAVESTGVQVPETGYAQTEIVENMQVTRALKDTSYWLSDPYGKGSYNEWMIDEFLAS